MYLTDHEKHLLDGGQGEAMATLLREQVSVGEFFGAERLIPIANAHFMGDLEVLGQAGLSYLTRLAEAGLTVAVPTTRNAQSVDFDHAALLGQSEELQEGERQVRSLLQRLGVSTVNTCIGYQSVYQPRFGEHVAWGDTGTVAYANSVLGARTNYESGAAGIAAALTGRTPAYGFHLDETRRANVRVRVSAPMEDLADWGALGAIIGERARGYWNVSAIELLGQQEPTQDDLKQLGASVASYGSAAMYHVVGVTPESPDLETAVGGRELIGDFEVTAEDIEEFFARDHKEGSDVDLVVFSGPQLSFFELDRLATRLNGRRVADDVRLIITSSSMICHGAEEVGILDQLRDAGATVLRGTCWYIMDPAAQREKFGWTKLVTNSAKLANIVRAHGFEPALRRTDECIEAAVSGKLVAR